MKRECSKHIYEVFKIIILLKIKLLHFSFKDYKVEKQKMLQKIEYICEIV
jgi:hypothetical protein